MRYLVIIFRLCFLASTFIYALPIVALVLRMSSKVSPLSSTSDSAETWFCRMVSLIFDSLSFWHRVKLDENAKTGSPSLSSSSKFIVICEFAFIRVAGSLSQSSMHAFFTDERILLLRFADNPERPCTRLCDKCYSIKTHCCIDCEQFETYFLDNSLLVRNLPLPGHSIMIAHRYWLYNKYNEEIF